MLLIDPRFGSAGLILLGARFVEPANVLEHPVRKRLYDAIRDHPGLHVRRLAEMVGLAPPSVTWHLRKLEGTGLVRSREHAKSRIYYAREGGREAAESSLANAALANPNANAIRELALREPGIAVTDVARLLGTSATTVRWHLMRLQEAGLLEARVTSRVLRVFPALRPPTPL